MTVLCDIAKKFCTDKLTNGYTTHYHNAFSSTRNDVQNVLELGVKEGASLLMWEEYFPFAKIYGVDKLPWLIDKSMGRIEIVIADQSRQDDLYRLERRFSSDKPDIIIDDASHLQADQQITFATLFPILKPGGIYIIEDLLTEYNRRIGDGWGSENKHKGRDLTLYALEQFEKTGKVPFMFAPANSRKIAKIDIHYTVDFPRRPWDGKEPKCSENWPGAVTAIIRKSLSTYSEK